MDLFGRGTNLSKLLGVDLTHATQLLSGIVAWTWDDLQLLCESLDRSPGFFLDKHAGTWPSDSKVVGSIEGGESLVWRVPEGFLRHPISLSQDVVLKYMTAPADMTAMFVPNSLLVFATHPHAALSLIVGDAYVIQHDDKIDVMRCISVTEESGRFEPLTEAIGGMVVRFPNDYSGQDARARVMGTVIGSIVPA